jgi:hypothetical protein
MNTTLLHILVLPAIIMNAATFVDLINNRWFFVYHVFKFRMFLMLYCLVVNSIGLYYLLESRH